MENEQALMVLLILIAVISAIQFVQLVSINNALIIGQYAQAAAPQQAAQSSIPAFQNLPSMVGGC